MAIKKRSSGKLEYVSEHIQGYLTWNECPFYYINSVLTIFENWW